MFDFPYKEKLKPMEESESEDAESLLPNGEGITSLRQRRKFPPYLVLTLIASHVIVLVLGTWLVNKFIFARQVFDTEKIQNYSPFVKDVGVKYHLVHFNGSFTHENIYRRDASPEVDAAWEALGVNYRPLTIPESEAERSGLAQDQVKINKKYGGGYPANVEGLHHLHCLNLVRKALVFNFDYYKKLGEGAFINENHIVKLHVTHCLDILRQQLMCTVDVGVLGQVWWDPAEPKPFTDFNTQHICRNFEDLRRWAEPRQLMENPPDDFLEPPKRGDRVYDEVP